MAKAEITLTVTVTAADGTELTVERVVTPTIADNPVFRASQVDSYVELLRKVIREHLELEYGTEPGA